MATENKGKAILFADGVKIKCRDGKEYVFPPFLLEDCFKFIELVDGNVALDVPFFNFIDRESADKYLEALMLAFKANYPDMTKDDISKVVDLKISRDIMKNVLLLNEIGSEQQGNE